MLGESSSAAQPPVPLAVKALEPASVAFFSDGVDGNLSRFLDAEQVNYVKALDTAWSAQLPGLEKAGVRKRFARRGREFRYVDEAGFAALEETGLGIYPTPNLAAIIAGLGEELRYDERSQEKLPHLVLPGRLLPLLENVIVETHRLVSYSMHTPVALSRRHAGWEGSVPAVNERSVLGGLLYRSKTAVTVPVSGSLNEQGRVEQPSFIPADLPAGMRAEFAGIVISSFNAFSSNLERVASVLAKYIVPPASAKPPVAGLFVKAVNYAIEGISSGPESDKAAMYAITLRTALLDIHDFLAPPLERIHKVWHGRFSPDVGYLAERFLVKTQGYDGNKVSFYHNRVYHCARIEKPVQLPALPGK